MEAVRTASTEAPIRFEPDSDGVYRRIPLVTFFQGGPVATFPLVTYAAHVGADLPSSGAVLGEAIILKDADGEEIQRIPINENGEMQIRFRTEPHLKKELEFYSVILAAEQKSMPDGTLPDLGVFRNSLVLLGREHPQTVETLNTPIGSMTPARYLMQTLSSLLNQDYLYRVPAPLMAVLLVVLCFVGLFLSRIQHRTLSGACLIAFIAYTAAMMFLVFYMAGIWADPLFLLIAPVSGWLSGRTLLPLVDSAPSIREG